MPLQTECLCNKMTASNWDKFKLLLWKIGHQRIAHKYEIFVCLFFSIISILLLLLLARANYIKQIEEKHFQPFEISNLQRVMNEMGNDGPLNLLYSPNTQNHFEEIVKNAVESLKLDGFQGYENPSDLTNALMSGYFLAGVQFDDTPKHPNKLSFALRFPSELRTHWNSTWLTTKLFPQELATILRNPDDEDGGVPVGYLREGFLPIQHAISMAYIKIASKQETLPEIQMQRYPLPMHLVFRFAEIPMALSIVGFICTYLIITLIAMTLTLEKGRQLKEIMMIMGLQNWIHWAAYFAFPFIWSCVTLIIITLEFKIDFGKGALLNNSSFTAVLFLYVVYAVSSICLAFMIATFCSKVESAEIMITLVFFGSAMTHQVLRNQLFDLSLTSILLWSFLPNIGLGFGSQVIQVLEHTGEGLQWNNMFSAEFVDGRVALGFILLIMLASTVIFMLICLYTEQILPGDFGVPQKWNFPFKSNFWCGEKENVGEEDVPIDKVHRLNPDAFEAEPANKNAGIQVKNLKKKFGEHEVVKDMSINMYEDEITVLLGHNGAGKTVTISMLAGMLSPTSGTIIINGFDIHTNLQGARQSIGICTQNNALFDDLSVKRHIVFFSALKGLKGKALKEEVKKYLKKMNSEDKAGVLSSKLSGGMKRKLSLCCAMCGGSKIVLLDEPSAGMDPVARRQLWDLLQSEKSGRTILLTTHLMDEADVLGDRIAILREGELKCYGTTFYLKSKYGSGYYLICVKRKNCNVEEVTALLRNYIPDIKPEIGIGTELSYQLPKSYSSQFENMFRALEENSESLNLNGYGVGIKSLEEIFIRMGAENTNEDSRKGQSAVMNESSGFPEDDLESIQSENNTRLLKGTDLVLNHWQAMFLKKWLHTLHNKFVYLTQVLLIVIVIPLVYNLKKEGPFDELKPITISLKQYPRAVTILEQDASLKDLGPDALEVQIADYYKKVANSFGPEYTFGSTGTSSFTDYILNLDKTSQLVINTRYLAAASVSKGKITAWLNNQPLHTAPLTLNMVHNAMAKALINPDAEITVKNSPLPFTAVSRANLLGYGLRAGIEVIFGLCLILSMVSAFYIYYVVNERTSNVKLLQFVSGINAWLFWLSHLICDLATFTAISFIFLICLACFQADGFSQISELACYFLFIILSGLSMLLFTYNLSFFFTDSYFGYSIALFVFFILVYLPFFRIFPHSSLCLGLIKIYQNWAIRETCNSRSMRESRELRCQLLPACCSDLSYFGWSENGLLPEITYLVISAVLCMLLLISIENGLLRKLKKDKKISTLQDPATQDNDVVAERERILHLSKDEIEGHNLVIDRISKRYNDLLAVDEVSLCVRQTECFGLLGSNGAGKTTLFKMLTGDLGITSGSAYVKGMNLKTDMRDIYKEISYCPQSNALFDYLTGRQILQIFCLLRGIRKDRIAQYCEKLSRTFDFINHNDKITKFYSGGNQRKLSTAITVIGRISVVYLDEPTTGIDPVARRHLWSIVGRMRQSGKSIVLTTHNMEECEVLSTRLAIMVKGKFKCIGMIQHLKNKFAKRLTLKIKVQRNEDLSQVTQSDSAAPSTSKYNDEDDSLPSTNIEKVKEFVNSNFPEATLQEEYDDLLTFKIPIAFMKWSQIFGLVESNKEKLNIEDYSISQTTLEEFFIEMIQMQSQESALT